MKTSRGLLLCTAVFLLPSCILYDQDLIDGATGSSSGGSATFDVTGSGGGVQTPGVGGALGVGGTGGVTPVAGGTGGVAPNAGGVPSMETGGTGSGGSTSCEGATGDFKDVTDPVLIDSFDVNWPRLSNDEASWNGSWSTAADDGALATFTPKAATLDLWDDPTKGYQSYSCDDSNLALHIEAPNSDSWGVSYDGKLMEMGGDVDLSAYTGVVFWARTSNNTQMSIVFASSGDPDDGGAKVPVPPLGTDWAQREIAFPMDADPAEIAIIKIVGQVAGGAPGDIDLWVESLSLY